MKKLLALVLIALLCVGVFAGCSLSDGGLEDAKEYVDSIMKPKAESTPADYEVLAQVTIGQETFTIEWSVDVTSGVKVVVAEDGKVTIDVDERAAADVAYVLKATIKNANGKTIETSYNRKVPAFKELTHSEFTQKADDEAVVIKGVITGIVNTDTKHEIYLEDSVGGYYVYNVAAEKMEGLVIGMEIRVLGVKGTYYGVHQVEDASIEIINATPAPVTPKDITAIINAAANLKDAALTKLQSTLVTIKGVTVLGQNAKDATYFDFAVNGMTTYVRISSSANMLTDAQTTTFKANVAANIGKSADVTGIVSIYNNQVYFLPVTENAFANFTLVDRTPAQQVEFEKGLMDAIGNITESGNVTLPTAAKLYTNVTISWAVSQNDYATVDGGKLKVPVLPDNATEITLTATLKSGDATTTKEFKVTLEAAPTKVGDKVAVPEVGKTYKFMVKQGNTKQTLYFIGEFNSGGFMLTSTNPDKAVDVGLEAVAGKTDEFYFYYVVGGAKAYVTLSIAVGEDGKVTKTVGYARNPANTYKYDAVRGALTTTVTSGETTKTYYFGAYNQYDTFSTSETSYIEDTSKIGVSQFVANFVTLIDTTTVPDADKVAREKTDLSIKTQFDAAGEVELPTNGGLFGKVTIAWAVSTNDALAIVDGKLVATPQKNETTATVTATITHGTVSETKEFTVTVAKAPTIVPVKVEEAPANGLKFRLAFLKNGALLLLDGTTQSSAAYRHNSTALVANALEYELVAVEGGFNIKTTVGGATKYLNIVPVDTHINLLLQDEAACVWVWDATLKTFIVNVEGKSEAYTMYNNPSYENVEAKTVSYAGNLVQLYVLVDTDSITDEQKVAQEKDAINVSTRFEAAGETALPAVGTTFDDVVIEWAVSTNACATIVDGKLVVTLPAIDTADVTFTLTATFKVDGETVDTKEFNITVVAPKTAATPIADLIKTDAVAGTYKAAGTVVAVNNKSFLLKDATGYILVYTGSAPTVVVGDKVTVNGATTQYNNTWQFGNTGLEVTKTGTETVTHPTATVVDATALDAFAAPIAPAYVKVTGVLVVDGSFFNLIVDGATKQGSLTYLAGDLKTAATALNGKKITVTGYTTGISSGKYVNLMVTAVEEATATDAEKVAIEKNALSITTSFNANGTLTLPAAGKAYTGVAVTWTVNGTAAAGEFAITQTAAAQTITVVATLTLGNETATKEFTVTVTALPTAGTVTVTKTANEINAITPIAADAVAALDNVISVKITKGDISTNPKLYTSSSDGSGLYILLYQNNNGKSAGNGMVFTAADGYVITSIKLTIYTNGQNAQNGTTLTVTGGTVEADANGNLVFTVNGDTLSFCSNSTDKNKDRIWIASISVTYAAE